MSGPARGDFLPTADAIEGIAAALGDVTTARVSYQLLMTGFGGREIPIRGDGFVDRTRDISSANLVVKDKPVESLSVRGDTFRRLTAAEQQKTGKLWRWVHHCRYSDDDLWAQIVAGMRLCALPTGDGAEILHGTPVHRYSFLVSPRRAKPVPGMASLHAHLRAHGRDRLTVHAWLADEAVLRKVRLHYSPAFPRDRRVRGEIEDYSDFGIAVDLAAPRPDQITGKPRGRRSRSRPDDESSGSPGEF
jgi:hypothetical protein